MACVGNHPDSISEGVVCIEEIRDYLCLLIHVPEGSGPPHAGHRELVYSAAPIVLKVGYVIVVTLCSRD